MQRVHCFRSCAPKFWFSSVSLIIILFFFLFNPLADAFEDAGAGDKAGGEEKVHVRVQQRNGRKCITTVAGLADDLDVKRICKAFKKNFSCNGAVQKDEDVGEVIQLSGDQRTNVKAFLVDQQICHAESIVLHGF
jgi:translation initiation factor 1